ncbi:MAG: hypothetical protein IT371_21520 [Deltaproteobacteria bacterium]|nr:hypothetical protein [Deltaproteobacteria bacterium]
MVRLGPWVLVLLAAPLACDGTRLSPPAGVVLADAELELVLDSARARFSLGRPGAQPLLETPESTPPGFGAPAWTSATADVRLKLGAFGFRESAGPWRVAERLLDVVTDGRRASASAMSSAESAELSAHLVSPGVVRVTLRAPEGSANRAALSFACHRDDEFLGLGAQTPVSHRGRVVPLWTQEQGSGKLDGQDHYGGYSPVGDTYDSYLPVPVLYNPRGYMVLVEGTARTVLDLCASHASVWRVQTWQRELSLLIVTGKTPLERLERMTAVTGRPPLPAPWVFAPWLDAIKGEAAVREVARLAREHDLPVSAIWTEDWAGGEESLGGYHLAYRWSVDRRLYPDLPRLSRELHEAGFRFLGYFNTFILQGTPEWDEAHSRGLLVRGGDGQVLTFAGPPRLQSTALLDLTRAETRTWVEARMRDALELGLDGWMADFGEWLPWEAVLADGSRGELAHNDYPRQWAGLNREVFARARPDGDAVYFVRSGWTGTQRLAPMVWAGDQNTSFARDDGLPSVIPIGLNLGLSGITTYGHDIGGYTSIFDPPTDRELFYRWTELGAFSPVMRTHHGTSGDKGWNFARDAETIAHFRRYAREHVRLYPYLWTLAQDAATHGWPLMRPVALHYPELPWNLADQYLLGDALLVAPVVERGATRRRVALPPGLWYDYFRGTPHRGSRAVEVLAPLEEVPVFVRAGAILPQLPDRVQTLASGGRGVVDLAAVQGELLLQVYLGAPGSFSLPAGRFELHSTELAPDDGALSLSLGRGPLPACPPGERASCVVRDPAGRRVTVYLRGAAFDLRGEARGREVVRLTGRLARETDLAVTLHY